MACFDLTDFEWSVIQLLLPKKVRGKARVEIVGGQVRGKGSAWNFPVNWPPIAHLGQLAFEVSPEGKHRKYKIMQQPRAKYEHWT